MRTLILSIFAVAVTSPAFADDPIGRFQLAPVTIYNADSKHADQRLFKIDTATGEVWELMHSELQLGQGSVVADGWVRVRDDYQSQLEGLLKARQAAPQKPTR